MTMKSFSSAAITSSQYLQCFWAFNTKKTLTHPYVLRTKYVFNYCVLTIGLPREVLAAESADRVSVAVILGTLS